MTRAFISVIVAGSIGVGAANGQGDKKDGQTVEHDILKVVEPKEAVMFERRVISLGGPDNVEFVSAEASVTGKVVKGAPYSAEAVTESTQTLADGNRITNKSFAAMYRDSEGRTRREMTFSPVGKSNATDVPALVMINDPVAGASYHLDTKAKTARKLPVAPFGVSFGMATHPVSVMRAGVPGEPAIAAHGPIAGAATIAIEQTSGPQGAIRMKRGSEPKTEALGKRAIDGVEVEGSRSTMTIPAGEMGNERDIQIVNERWYSAELQTVIRSTHSDPRMGETTFSLTNIRRSDPHPSLFQVPSDYTLAPSPDVRFIRKLDHK